MVAPKDRIKFWNIVPGDKIRLLGDSTQKIHEVFRVNKLDNTVHLLKDANKGVRVPSCIST
jgi:hypothetical protein